MKSSLNLVNKIYRLKPYSKYLIYNYSYVYKPSGISLPVSVFFNNLLNGFLSKNCKNSKNLVQKLFRGVKIDC